MGLGIHSDPIVAIVAGGATLPGRDVARGLARWAWSVVIVYLDHQSHAEAAVAEIINEGGAAVAVRADLLDTLDVQRLFTESIAAFGDVDVVVDTTTECATLLYEQAARYVRVQGAIVSTVAADPIPPLIASQLQERGVSLGWVPPEGVLAFLDMWRHQANG